MPNYYEILKIKPQATPKEIKAAYRKLAKTCHPDKVPGKEQQFINITQAYETLIDDWKRKCYNLLLARETGVSRTEVHVHFVLIETPNHYDHYAYLNAFFELKPNEELKIGDEIPEELRSKIWNAKDKVYNERSLEEKLYLASDDLRLAQTKRIELLTVNHKKCNQIIHILKNSENKALYDLSLGFYQNNAFKEMEQQLGGRAILVKAIESFPDYDFAPVVFILYKAKLLTPEHFKQSLKHPYYHATFLAIIYLDQANLLTKANLDLLKEYAYYEKIHGGLMSLLFQQILNQRYLEIVIRAKNKAETMGRTLAKLKFYGCLNAETSEMVEKSYIIWEVYKTLELLKKECSPNQLELLHWKGPETIQPLIHAINQMFAYGLVISLHDMDKAKVVMFLALDLLQDLRAFMSYSPNKKAREATNFKQDFIQKLHSQDAIMATHRAYWKVIIANILIALTGAGLIALGVYYLINRQCFFAQTMSEKKVEAVEHAAALHLQ